MLKAMRVDAEVQFPALDFPSWQKSYILELYQWQKNVLIYLVFIPHWNCCGGKGLMYLNTWILIFVNLGNVFQVCVKTVTVGRTVSAALETAAEFCFWDSIHWQKWKQIWWRKEAGMLWRSLLTSIILEFYDSGQLKRSLITKVIKA